MSRMENGGHVVILDGGNGSEAGKLAPDGLNPDGWLTSINMTHPDTVREVHRRYLAAGAEIILTNTYTSNRMLLAAAGLEHTFRENNVRAVRLAMEARSELGDEAARARVLVCGSVSAHAPGNELDKMRGVVPWGWAGLALGLWPVWPPRSEVRSPNHAT